MFRNLLDAAEGALIRAAASTRTLGSLESLMRRIVISLLAGTSIAIGSPMAAALMLYRGESAAIIPTLLYWPLSVTDKLGLGLNCGHANLISDKLTCIRTALFIDFVLYPAIICVCAYLIHHILFRRRARLRPSHVA